MNLAEVQHSHQSTAKFQIRLNMALTTELPDSVRSAQAFILAIRV